MGLGEDADWAASIKVRQLVGSGDLGKAPLASAGCHSGTRNQKFLSFWSSRSNFRTTHNLLKVVLLMKNFLDWKLKISNSKFKFFHSRCCPDDSEPLCYAWRAANDVRPACRPIHLSPEVVRRACPSARDFGIVWRDTARFDGDEGPPRGNDALPVPAVADN